MPFRLHLEDADLPGREGDLPTDAVGCGQHMGGGKRRVAAEGYFHGRGEPPEIEDAAFIVPAAGEGGLGEVVLRRDRLHQRVIQPRIEDQHGSRVAGEEPFREGIDLEHGEGAHDVPLAEPPGRREASAFHGMARACLVPPAGGGCSPNRELLA